MYLFVMFFIYICIHVYIPFFRSPFMREAGRMFSKIAILPDFWIPVCYTNDSNKFTNNDTSNNYSIIPLFQVGDAEKRDFCEKWSLGNAFPDSCTSQFIYFSS